MEDILNSWERDLFIVGVGASAGGLEALELFFSEASADKGLAYVVVQHLSPDFDSLMDQLLSRVTNLPIQLIENGTTVLPDTIYLMPPRERGDSLRRQAAAHRSTESS